MNQTTIILIILLFVGWSLQSILAIWQTKKIFKEIGMLRSIGWVGMGFAGNIYKRKIYGLVVVDQNQIIQKAELLSGWTVFAKFKPVNGLEGINVRELIDQSKGCQTFSAKETNALKAAAKNYLDSFDKTIEKKTNLANREVHIAEISNNSSIK